MLTIKITHTGRELSVPPVGPQKSASCVLSFGHLCNTQGDGLENILATGMQFAFLSFPSYSFVSTIKLNLIFTYRSGSVMATQCVFYAAKTETSDITFRISETKWHIIFRRSILPYA